MKIAIYNNSGELSKRVSVKLKQRIEQSQRLEIDDLSPDIVISVGGDGTLLSAFHHYIEIIDQVRLVGIHTGHLGFYTDWRDYEVDELINSLENDNGQSETYPLLEITTKYLDGDDTDVVLALNESTIKEISGTLTADVYIKDQKFESFRGDGLCISTPSGSTAYNKSVGGAIINPSLKALQVSEIASINNRVFRTLGSPLIISPDEWVKIIPDIHKKAVLTCDQQVRSGRPIKSIEYKIAEKRVAFAQYRHTHFWQRVNNAFIGVQDDSI